MTIVFRDGDVPALYADMGVPIVLNGIPGRGLVDENDSVIVSDGGRGEVVGGVHTVTVQTSAFGPIANGQPIVVDGVSYSVRQKLKEGDAALSKILLGSV